MKKYNVCVIGATGLVGSEMVKTLLKRQFPIENLKLFATSKSAGTKVKTPFGVLTVEELKAESFKGMDIALFSGGEIASEEYAHKAVEQGCVVIDNSASFRMDKDVPLVVPEVNPEALSSHKGIIANPNCSTIQMVAALKPIYDAVGINRVIVSTYQSVSGTGKQAIEALDSQIKAVVEGENPTVSVYPYQIAFNIIPQIGSLGENGYYSEELKMIYETKKILTDDSIRVSATTVRVPVKRGHCESVNIETKSKITPQQVRELLAKQKGIKVLDDPQNSIYPTPLECSMSDDVFIGRIREDLSCENAIEMWVVSDNLLKGAALNAVQIAETLIEKGLL